MSAKKTTRKQSAKKKKSSKKKATKSKPGKKKVHSVKVKSGRPSPRHKTGVHTGDEVHFTKSDHAARYVQFANSPFQAGGGYEKFAIPDKVTVVANPTRQKSYPYDVLDKDGNVISDKAISGPPNPPDIVVG